MSIWSSDPTEKEQQQNEWLTEDNVKIILCDLVYHDGSSLKVGYFSNYNYILDQQDSFTNLLGEEKNNISYIDNLINIPNIISKIDADVSVGAIEFLNAEGLYDDYITYAWEGHPLRLSIGDPSWIRDDFIIILDGISSNIVSPRPNIMAISIRDKKEVFNKKVQTTLINEDYITNLYASNSPAFIIPLSNALRTNRGIEINISSNATAIDIADVLALTIDSIPDFSVTHTLGTDKLIITTILSGDIEDSHDGLGDPENQTYNTGFSINSPDDIRSVVSYGFGVLTINSALTGIAGDYDNGWVKNITLNKWALISSNSGTLISIDPAWQAEVATWQVSDSLYFYLPADGINGDPSTPEVTVITPIAESNGNLTDTYFHLHSRYRNFYVWINVDYTSVDPELVETDLVVFNEDPIGGGFVTIPDAVLNTPVPICLGKCYNIEPKLIDIYNHVYQIHEGPITEVTEVRANGVTLEPELYEVNINIGCFRLLVHQNNTQITCDVIGPDTRATGYNQDITISIHSAAHLVEWLALEKAGLSGSDICPNSFPSDIFTNTSAIGLYIKDETDIAPLITDIMTSVGGFARFGRVCVLQIKRVEDPSLNTPVLYLTEDSILEKGISLSSTEAPKESIVLGYKKNWTVQDKGTLAGVVIDSSGDYYLNRFNSFTKEFSSAVATNTGITEQYPLAETTELLPTLLFTEDAGNTEVTRRAALRSKKRFVYRLLTVTAPFTINVGDTINLTHSRFGFLQGRNCLVIGMEEQPTKQRVDLEVWL